MKVDPRNPCHPITLPFMNPHSFKKLLAVKSEEDAAEEEDAAGGAPGLKKEDDTGESRSRPADVLFRADDGTYSGQDQIFFVQLPTSLPSRPTHQPAAPQPIAKPPVKEEGDMIVDVKDEANASADPPPRVLAKAGEVDEILGFRNTLANLPSDRVEKIRLFKSGKVHLVLGGIEYDVSTGMTCNFLQEALAIDSTHLYQLGDITKRMVCYPIVPDLLSKATSDMEPVIVDD
jgi:hypothetical protein